MKAYSKLKAEIRRHWRSRYRQEMERLGEPLPPDFSEQQPGDGDLDPPDAQRVARRACCLAAVALRGLAGTWEQQDQQEFLPKLSGWFSSTGLDDEIEADELQIINAEPGSLTQQELVNATWRWEGAAVLAASLGRLPLPPHDTTAETKACGDACGLFMRRDQLQELSDTGKDSIDRFAYANRAIAIHWRLRQFCQVEQKHIDFAKYASGVQWADFDLTGLPLIDGDLAIGGQPISRADPDHVSMAMSIASERHIAANWLIGWNSTYSEVENPT